MFIAYLGTKQMNFDRSSKAVLEYLSHDKHDSVMLEELLKVEGEVEVKVGNGDNYLLVGRQQ